jgi:hypothetical protein
MRRPLTALAIAALATTTLAASDAEWAAFKHAHRRSGYASPAEELSRRATFDENVALIEAENALAGRSWT